MEERNTHISAEIVGAEEEEGLTRGALLRRAAGASIALAGASPLLKAGTALAAGSGSPGVSGIKAFLGPINPKYSGSGLSWPIGSSQLLTGASRLHSIDMVKGTQLAQEHIMELGGPKIQYVLEDNGAGSNDPTKATTSMLIFANDHAPAVQTSAAFGNGVEIPIAEKDHILLLDAGAGNGFFPGKAYAWGGRSTWPTDFIPTAARFSATQLNAKTVTVVNPVLPAALATGIGNAITAAASTYNLQISNVSVPEGATDYSTAITQIRSNNPDLVWSINGEYVPFLQQYSTSGVSKPVMVFDMDQATINQAGTAIEGVYGVQDYFNPDHPNNPWAAIFAKSFAAKFGEKSSYYAAAFYEDAFALWAFLRLVLAKKGNPRSGQQLQAALEAHPGPYPSLFGGTSSKVGTLLWDPKEHGLVNRPIQVFHYTGGKYVTLATAVAGGAQYRTV